MPKESSFEQPVALISSVPLQEKPRLMQAGAAAFNYASESYFLPKLWQLHLYQHTGELRVKNAGHFGEDKGVYDIKPGAINLLPPDTYSEYRLNQPGRFYYAHIAFDGAPGSANVPVMQYLDYDLRDIEALFEEAIGCFAARAWRAEMKIWEILCRLSERIPAGDRVISGGHPAVARAQQIIALRLNEPISAEEIARATGVSHSHLNRLFHTEIGMSIKSHLTACRMQRACYLLIYSRQSIKSIAADVGIPDLHLFNKVIRRHLGAPPTTVRASGIRIAS